ncbi:MAG: hypothetical protein CMN97_11755 [Synechococcus sp. NAT40]|mgnify:CR=1 FL=1|nr:hypothetical protein [Synechococcus sp. NAT40]
MSLSQFEVAVGGISSIPVLSAIIFGLYKGMGEKNLVSTQTKKKTTATTTAKSSAKNTKGDQKPTDKPDKTSTKQVENTAQAEKSKVKQPN